MPGQTITIPGVKKPVPKALVYAGAAATIGIVGYAYFTKSSGAASDGQDTAATLDLGDERIPPTTLDTYDVKVDNRVGYKTDQEWYAAALDLLINNYGVGDTATASKTLDSFVRNQAVTQTQADMLHYVVNTIGYPPSGQLTIKLTTTTPPTGSTTTRATPGNVGGLKLSASATEVRADWTKAPNAGTYRIDLTAGTRVIREDRVTGTSWKSGGGLTPGKPYRITVWGISNQNVNGPKSSGTVHTSPAGNTAVSHK